MNRTNPNFYEQYGLKNVRESMKRPFHEAFPDKVPAQSKPQMELRVYHVPDIGELRSFQFPNQPVDFSSRFEYPASEPEFRSYPALENKYQGYMAVVPQATYSSAHASLQAPAGQRKNEPRERPTKMGNERPAKRQRTDAVSHAISDHPSEPSVSVPDWHESKLIVNENPAPYMEFFRLKSEQGEEFTRRILSQDNYFDNLTDRIKFTEEMLLLVPAALERWQRGDTHISEIQLGKLVISVFCLTRKIQKSFEKDHCSELTKKIVSFTLSIIHRYPSIAGFVKNGLCFDSRYQYQAFGGKAKLRLILWCAENKTFLSQKELNFLIENRYYCESHDGESMLKKLRKQIKDFNVESST